MANVNPHLTDREITMAADGDASQRLSAKRRAHLESCWACRERLESVRGMIPEFVRARGGSLEAQIPESAAARNRLILRLAERTEAGPAWHVRFWRAVPAASLAGAALAIAILSVTTRGAEGSKPRASLTPGEARSISIGEVCRTPRAQVTAEVSEATRQRVFSEYGIRGRNQNNFEVDYLITPDLGGARSLRNLWPQPYSARWNAQVKDRLEQRLHELVCDGRLDLTTAQREIAADWIGAYKKYMGVRTP